MLNSNSKNEQTEQAAVAYNYQFVHWDGVSEMANYNPNKVEYGGKQETNKQMAHAKRNYSNLSALRNISVINI